MKTLKFMLAAATAIGLASATQADQYNTTGFEKLTVGDPVTTGVEDNRSGYSYFYYAGATAEDNESVIAAAGDMTGIARPRGAAAVDAGREKILQVSTGTDPLFRTRNPLSNGEMQNGQALGATTYVDTLVQFTVTPYTDQVTPAANQDKLMVYLGENTNDLGEVTSKSLKVVGGFLGSNGQVSQDEYEVTNVSVDTNTWYRLTVKAIPDVSVDDQGESANEGSFMGFQIYIDGTLCTLNKKAFDDTDDDGNAAWDFVETSIYFNDLDRKQIVLSLLATSNDPTKDKLRAVGFAGEGKVDDIVFSDLDPFATVFDFTFALGTGVSAVTYTVGGVEYDQARTFAEVEANTQVAITSVTYADDYMAGSTTAVNLSDPVEGVYTVTNAGASLTITPAEAYASVGATKYASFAEANAAAGAGDTLTLLRDAVGPISTAAGTLDLNDKKLGATKIEFTGTGAKTLTGGDVTNLAAITVVSPAGQNLTIDDMTFHFDITPVGTGSVLTVSNCTFENDLDNKGKTGEAADGDDRAYHSFGLKLLNSAKNGSASFGRADVVGNTFKQARRCGLAINEFVGDTYVYDNEFDGTKNCLNYTETTNGSRFAAMQIYAQGRVFIENNSFSGTYIAEPFALYNEKTNISSDKALVFNGNTVASTVPYLWAFYESPETPLPSVTNAPNLFFGSNTIAAAVDKTQGKYKTVVQPVPVEYAENLALPTGYTTVYDWSHNDGTTAYYVNDAFAANLDNLAVNDVLTAFPGADVTLGVVGIALTDDATYKNKWTVSVLGPEPSGTELEPGEKESFGDTEPTPQQLDAITIVASDAVSNALQSAGASIATYEGRFETVAVQEGGVWYAEVVMKASTTNTLQTQVNNGAAEVIGALDSRSVTFTATPGFYYWINYGPTLSATLPYNTERVLADDNEVNIPMPSGALGQTAQFFKVMVDYAPAPLTGGQGGQD